VTAIALAHGDPCSTDHPRVVVETAARGAAAHDLDVFHLAQLMAPIRRGASPAEVRECHQRQYDRTELLSLHPPTSATIDIDGQLRTARHWSMLASIATPRSWWPVVAR
jgi:hypothetical protein